MFGRILSYTAVMMLACGFWCVAEPSGVWLDVPFVKQAKNGCGAASIAMVMQFWQRQQGRSPDNASDAREIEKALYSSRAHGIYASDLERYLRAQGFRAFAFEGTRDDLRQHLEKGRPLIVALKLAGQAPLHYVVVVGLDPENQLILVNDPAERKLLKREQANFEKEWRGAGNWALLAVPQAERGSSEKR
jgi:ABC-type bacteriocin/lantibiotic exporter with double-glycine peptidase domain